MANAPTAYAYDFLNFDALTGLLANDGDEVVSPSGARYKAIYLGGTTRMMTLPALRKLATLVEGGATVIGRAPVADPSLADADGQFAALVAKLWPGGGSAKVGKGQVIADADVEAGLATIRVRSDFRFTAGAPGPGSLSCIARPTREKSTSSAMAAPPPRRSRRTSG